MNSMQFWETDAKHALDPRNAATVRVDFRQPGGVHLGPQSRLFRALQGLDVTIYAKTDSYEGIFPHVSLIGLMAFAGLYLCRDCEIDLTICGPDREAACDQLERLFDPHLAEDGYGEVRLEGSCRRIQS